MATSTLATNPTSDTDVRSREALWFAAGVLLVAAGSWLLAAWAPLGFSIVAVFLFAAPHNWFEARYFLQRMPARWGKLWSYYATGLAGVVLLTTAFAIYPWLLRSAGVGATAWLSASAAWNTGLVLWVLVLIAMRCRQNPRRQWDAAYPIGFLLIAAAWVWPLHWSLMLVYLHPLVALWFLDRELKKNQPQWRSAYHACLLVIASLLVGLWWTLADAPHLAGQDALTTRITQHAGAHLLQGVSSHLLVATHTFLEMLHYGVWLVAIPLVGLRTKPWQFQQVPLARRSVPWRRAVAAILVTGGLLVLAFWAAFLADYPLTRDVYFTVAMLHVLAEVPFLLRQL